MRILIIGAGNAGRQLTLRLCEEKHSVVMIDIDPDVLAEAEATLDILTVCGSGSSPQVLEEAQVGKCHLCIAVTDSDEVNILACLFAHAAGVPRNIARVASPEYIHANNAYDLTAMGIDLVINQKQECANEMFQNLRMPGAVEAFTLLAGRVLVAGFRIGDDTPLNGSTPATCPRPDLIQDIRMIAVHRDGELIIPYGSTLFKAGDLVYILGERGRVKKFSEWVCPHLKPMEKVIIAGGGDLGLMLAKLIEDAVECVLLEKDEERALLCSSELSKTLVLRADALAESTLTETGITNRTAFVALTGDDEDNIINCMMARKHGVVFTVAQIARTDYIPVIESLNLIDRIVSPYISTTHAILHYLRSQKIKAAALLHNLPGELLDVIIQKDSKLCGKKIREIKMPRQAIVATVLREHEVVAATGDLRLAADDRLVIFTHQDVVKKIQSVFLK
ncbi:MAG: Trk system potassium transporter TrkA [Kiritimatiellae bacterium]|nr:Trk system potassium transporter TrkA [Kiritimatiellia bacterium]